MFRSFFYYCCCYCVHQKQKIYKNIYNINFPQKTTQRNINEEGKRKNLSLENSNTECVLYGNINEMFVIYFVEISLLLTYFLQHYMYVHTIIHIPIHYLLHIYFNTQYTIHTK